MGPNRLCDEAMQNVKLRQCFPRYIIELSGFPIPVLNAHGSDHYCKSVHSTDTIKHTKVDRNGTRSQESFAIINPMMSKKQKKKNDKCAQHDRQQLMVGVSKFAKAGTPENTIPHCFCFFFTFISLMFQSLSYLFCIWGD